MNGIVVAEFGGPEVLRYVAVPDPVPKSTQVVIEVKGASVNFADTKARSGSYHLGKQPPFIPGIDVAGVVSAVGSEVRRINIGDRVIAFPSSGSYAERSVADENLTFVIPDALSFETAAACPIVAGTVIHMLTEIADIRHGETVLVHAAAGGVGSTALQAATALGASRVFASTGSAWKESFVKKCGAHGVIDYNSQNYENDIKDLTEGKGVDVILNPIGGATIGRDLSCLAPFGRLVVFGALQDEIPRVPPAELFAANKALLGFSFGHVRKFRPERVHKTVQKVLEMLDKREIDITPGARFPLQDAVEAHRLIEQRKVVGKIVLIP